jgi:hypothetical protein
LERSGPFSWEEWFRHASAQQRDEALGLARQQGVLYPSQLSRSTNGVHPLETIPENETAKTLVRVLSGKADTLADFCAPTLQFFDTELDELQQQAVRRAIGTPDIFLLQGLPGTGKSRAAAEIMLQAAARGWRVLFLAAQPASLDVVLHRWVGRQDVFAIRYLEPLENADLLPAWLRGFTLAEQRQAFLERVLAGARANREEMEASCRGRQAEEPIWSDLRSCAERVAAIDGRLRELQDNAHRLDGADGLSTAEADSPFARYWHERRRSLEQALQEIDHALAVHMQSVQEAEQVAARLGEQIASLEPRFRARKTWQFWRLAFWTQILGQVVHEMESLQAQLRETQSRQEQARLEIARQQECRRGQQEQFDAEFAAALSAEIQTRRQTAEQQSQSLLQERRLLEADWQRLCQPLREAPAEPALAALEPAMQAWLRRKKEDEEQCQFARQWTEFVEATGPQLASRLPGLANVLAGTLTGWQTDRLFREAAASAFDLVVIEDADTLTEAELLPAARQARRCVLVGRTFDEARQTARDGSDETRSLASLLPSHPVGQTFNRVWQSLGGDAGLWPHSWRREENRLICHLLPLQRTDRPHVYEERLADAAEIELRIVHRPKETPRLAQMVFPSHWTFAEALTFVVREAQELPIQPVCQSGWWSEDSRRCSWHTAPSATIIDAWLELEAGVRLGTVAAEDGEGFRLGHIDFDRETGWDREKANGWLDRYRPVHDHGRTVMLQTPHRFGHPLAQSIIALVCADGWLPVAGPRNTAAETTFEFCSVPSCPGEDLPRTGAGLELDLSAGRHADRLPAELRQGLPARGFVNYLEAQSLVRRLESLVEEGDLTPSGTSCRVAVLALYESQVELLRRLIARSWALRSPAIVLEVALPSKMHQRECDIVLLSLTRSHTHRSAAFGDDIRELPLALTRARSRLLVFGDVGMLCKRAHWHGPLDHLDAHASHQEHVRLSRLFTCAQQCAKKAILV